MTFHAVPGLATVLGVLAQATQPAAGFSAETVASSPAIVAKGLRFLMGAFSAVWIILTVYLFTLSWRLRRLSRQVERLKEKTSL